MKPFLLDVNLLVALLWPSHIHHRAAMKWFTKNRATGWATCPMTEAAFVRIVSNPAFSRDAVAPTEAIAVLRTNTDADDHQFWPDEENVADTVSFAGRRLVGHQQVTDAYLLGLALRRGGVLATFDDGVAALLESKAHEARCLEILKT